MLLDINFVHTELDFRKGCKPPSLNQDFDRSVVLGINYNVKSMLGVL